MFEDFTFDQRVDSRARPNPQRETALSPREVYAEWPPPPARDAAAPATRCAGYAFHHHLHPRDPVDRAGDDGNGTNNSIDDHDDDACASPDLPRPSETAVDSLARQLGRQTLRPDVQPQLHRQRLMNDATFRHPEPARLLPRGGLPCGDIPGCAFLPPRPTAAPPLPLPRPLPQPSAAVGPDFAIEPPWQHPRAPPPPPHPLDAPAPSPHQLPNARAVRQNLIESMIINGDQCNVQNSEPITPLPPPWTSLLTVDPLVAASDGVDAQMANSGFPLEVDDGGWGERGEGEGEPIIRLLSYRRAGAPTRIQKVGLGYRSSQDTALRCANLKKNVTKMRRRDRKPSRPTPTPGAVMSTAETPST